jgi:hypothetical protein
MVVAVQGVKIWNGQSLHSGNEIMGFGYISNWGQNLIEPTTPTQ